MQHLPIKCPESMDHHPSELELETPTISTALHEEEWICSSQKVIGKANN